MPVGVDRKRVSFWLGLVLGVGLFGFLLVRYEPERVLLPILDSRWHLLVAVMGLQLGIQFLNALTPAVLLGSSPDRPLSLWHRTRAFLALQPVALLAPGRLSDFGALLALRRHHPTGAVASAIVVDKLVTLFLILLLTPVALRTVAPGSEGLAVDIAVLGGIVLVVAAPFLLIDRRLRGLVNRYILRAWPSLLRGFGAHTEALLRASKARVAANFGLTGLKVVLAALALSLLARNFESPLGVGTAIWMSVLIQLATALPLAPQGLGIAEGSLVLLFSLNGLSETAAMSVGITGRALFLPVMALVYVAVTLPTLTHEVSGGSAGPAAGSRGADGAGDTDRLGERR